MIYEEEAHEFLTTIFERSQKNKYSLYQLGSFKISEMKLVVFIKK